MPFDVHHHILNDHRKIKYYFILLKKKIKNDLSVSHPMGVKKRSKNTPRE